MNPVLFCLRPGVVFFVFIVSFGFGRAHQGHVCFQEKQGPIVLQIHAADVVLPGNESKRMFIASAPPASPILLCMVFSKSRCIIVKSSVIEEVFVEAGASLVITINEPCRLSPSKGLKGKLTVSMPPPPPPPADQPPPPPPVDQPPPAEPPPPPVAPGGAVIGGGAGFSGAVGAASAASELGGF